MINKEFLVEFFSQGLVRRGGNCASVALIKCAIGRYDLGVFEAVKNVDGYLISLKKNPDQNAITFPIKLSASDLKIAESMHGFILQKNDPLSKQYFEYAELCYAVMGKVCQILRKYKNYSNALNDLNRGENTDDIPRYLGLDECFMPVVTKGEDISNEEFDKKVNTLSNVLLYSNGHAVFSSQGIFDDHGEIVPYSEENYGFEYFRIPV